MITLDNIDPLNTHTSTKSEKTDSSAEGRALNSRGHLSSFFIIYHLPIHVTINL